VVKRFCRAMKVHSAETRRKDSHAHVIFEVAGLSNVKEWLQSTLIVVL
jgi:hypothetical protein